MRRLYAWFPPHLIGILEETDDGLSFRYAREWLGWEKRFQLSASLKLRDQKYRKEAAAFFGNLLPEGGARSALCRKLGISVDNDFELLVRIGQDCAGALVLTEDENPPAEKGDLEEIPARALADWLKEDSTGILDLQVKGDMRLSLAGAQNKLPLVYKNNRFYKPLGSQPTTHILKPPPKGFKNLPQNEWFQAQVYAAFDLATAKSHLIKVGAKYVLLVERYDRLQEGDTWKRLHQEDFCQALAVSFKRKYEAEGGPTLLKCCALIEDRSNDVSSDLDAILKWQMLNVLTGNCDGHGKNLSLLRLVDGTWRLAPFYDLVNTKLYPKLNHNLAMSVADQFDAGTIHPEHWKKLFTDVRVSPTSYLATFRALAEKLPEVIDNTIQKFHNEYGRTVFLDELKTHQLKLIRRNRRIHSF